jgi:hypothetical protein
MLHYGSLFIPAVGTTHEVLTSTAGATVAALTMATGTLVTWLQAHS